MFKSSVPNRLIGLWIALARASLLGYGRNPPCGNKALSFQTSRFCETRLMSDAGMIFPGNGAAAPGYPMVRGVLSDGYHRLPGCSNSEKSPLRMASVGTEVELGVPLLSRRASQLKSQKVRSLRMGPDATTPY